MLLILALVLPLAACGRKPTGLQPPENAAADAYPQVYPKPLPGEAAPTVPDSDLVTKYKARPEQALQ
jgi:predicted small lipoprotein YifL